MQKAARFILAICVASLAFGFSVPAQSEQNDVLSLELNTVEQVGPACRLTFVATNITGQAIDKAMFETVIFDAAGGVVSLKLFDFRALPVDRPRVRQFDLTGMGCDDLGQVLINGASSCVVGGTESALCQGALSLKSRIDVELLG